MSFKTKPKALTPQQSEGLRRLYYSPRTGLQSVNKFFRKAKLAGLGVTYEQTKNWLSGQYTVQAHRPQNKPKEWNSITSAGPGYNYQMDLLDYSRYRYPSSASLAYAWILVIIDVNSRYAAVRALKVHRDGKVKGMDYLDAYKDMIEKDIDGRNPKDLNLDNEFTARVFVEYVESQGTRLHYSEVGQFNKNAIVERFNRTIALMIEKYRFHSDDINWPSYLQDMVHNYNQGDTRGCVVGEGDEQAEDQVFMEYSQEG